MTLAQEFNSLNGLIVSRKTLEDLLLKAEKEKNTIISKRVRNVLQTFKNDTFLIEINNLVEPFGLNGVKKTTKETPRKKPDTNRYEVHTNTNKKRTKIIKKTNLVKAVRKPVIKKSTVLKTVAKPVAKEKKAVANPNLNKNSLAYKMANKPTNVAYFKIQEKAISEFLGQIEKKEKESIVISLTGGQGSMKTRMCFQFMNAFAQNYKVGHASIEEHPESVVYYDKAEEYLNAKALQNIEAPEIKSVADLNKLIVSNDVIIIDSFSKMQEMQKGFEVDKDLRKKYNGKLFIVIFQQTTDGKMRGGSKSQFDADVVLFTEKKSDYRENYIFADKNRYQNKPLDTLKFNIFNKKLVPVQAENRTESKTKKKLSFTVN
ncbi:hypothetical protein [uncultured Flavobacterium sp.]|uniref:hypothetical protein n=1 Tax=uncultured Flavobacterium sp. TaxID=165435 RepID=UPI00308198F1